MGKNKVPKHKKKISKKKKILITLSIFLILALGGAFIALQYVKSKIYVEPTVETVTTEEEEEKVEYEVQEGITNILLIGTDARDLKESARSDSIIIATIDNNKDTIKLTSIMRDTLVDIPGYSDQKINAALALGGPELLMKTIRENFSFSVDKYVMVNFWGFEAIIDYLGGIDLEVKDYEIDEINKFIGECDEVKSPALTEAGMQHLDGQQALSFSRIRKVGNGSYERTERQRRVLSEIVNKVKDTNPIKYLGIVNELLPYIQTNIEPTSLLNYAYTVYSFNDLNFQQLQIPINFLAQDCIYRDRGWVLLIDKDQNGKMLNDFIYRDILPDEKNVDYNSLYAIMDKYKKLNDEYTKLYGQPSTETTESSKTETIVITEEKNTEGEKAESTITEENTNIEQSSKEDSNSQEEEIKTPDIKEDNKEVQEPQEENK